MIDRRRFVRWQVARDAKIRLEGQDTDIDCRLDDISFKGMKLCLTKELKRDKYLKVCLTLSDESSVDIELWVVWHRTLDGHNIYGLYFSRIRDADKEKIFQYVRKHFPDKINRVWWEGVSTEGGEAMEDRRVFARTQTSLPVSYLNLRKKTEGKAQAWDISAKGISLVADEELTTYTPLEMWLDVPGRGEPLYTRGEVVWSKLTASDKYRIGVNLEKADLKELFQDLSKDSKA